MLAEDFHNAGRGAGPLAAGDVDADHVAPLLVDDRVESDGRLAGLPVADDQLALTAADGGHRVDRLDAGLQGLFDRLTGGDSRSDRLDGPAFVGDNRPLAVQGIADGIDHAADERLADGDRQQFPGRLDLVPFGDLQIVAQDDHAD